MQKSKGHLEFKERRVNPDEPMELIEIFERDTMVFSAPARNPVMADGYRVGRYICTEKLWRYTR